MYGEHVCKTRKILVLIIEDQYRRVLRLILEVPDNPFLAVGR